MIQPVIHPTAKVLKGAVVSGNVTLGEKSCIWFNAVARGDIEAITIGSGTSHAAYKSKSPASCRFINRNRPIRATIIAPSVIFLTLLFMLSLL